MRRESSRASMHSSQNACETDPTQCTKHPPLRVLRTAKAGVACLGGIEPTGIEPTTAHRDRTHMSQTAD